MCASSARPYRTVCMYVCVVWCAVRGRVGTVQAKGSAASSRVPYVSSPYDPDGMIPLTELAGSREPNS